MGKFTKFSTEEKERIRRAVQELEQSTSGELRPVFVRRSDNYAEARWFGACIGALVGIGTIVMLSYLWLLPGSLGVHVLFLMLLALMVAGYFVPVLFPGIGVQLAGQRRAGDRVLQRAAEVFLAEEVFNTRDRIGILLMVSELERNIVLLADSGINQLVDQSEWDAIVQEVVHKIKRRAYTDGIVDAIVRCRELLLANGFTPGTDDVNELPDDIRTID